MEINLKTGHQIEGEPDELVKFILMYEKERDCEHVLTDPAVKDNKKPRQRRHIKKKRSHKKWTPLEDAYLKSQQNKLTTAQLAKRLGRSRGAIKVRLWSLNGGKQ